MTHVFIFAGQPTVQTVLHQANQGQDCFHSKEALKESSLVPNVHLRQTGIVTILEAYPYKKNRQHPQNLTPQVLPLQDLVALSQLHQDQAAQLDPKAQVLQQGQKGLRLKHQGGLSHFFGYLECCRNKLNANKNRSCYVL